MTEAIVWTVLWFVSIGIGSWVLTALGALVAAAAEQVRWAVLGWVLGLAWGVYALIQFLIQLIDTIKIIWP